MFVEADPYPWPYDGGLVADRLALVICGAQRWFYSRTAQPNDALDRVARIASLMRPSGASIVAVRHGSDHHHQGRPVLPLVGSSDYQLIIEASAADALIDAAGIDAFYGSNIDAYFRARGIDTLVVVGLAFRGNIPGPACLSFLGGLAGRLGRGRAAKAGAELVGGIDPVHVQRASAGFARILCCPRQGSAPTCSEESRSGDAV